MCTFVIIGFTLWISRFSTTNWRTLPWRQKTAEMKEVRKEWRKEGGLCLAKAGWQLCESRGKNKMATLHERKRERERRKAFLPLIIILLFKTIRSRGFNALSRIAAKVQSSEVNWCLRTGQTQRYSSFSNQACVMSPEAEILEKHSCKPLHWLIKTINPISLWRGCEKDFHFGVTKVSFMKPWIFVSGGKKGGP